VLHLAQYRHDQVALADLEGELCRGEQAPGALPGGLSSAARCSAVTATASAPRRRARPAASSSSLAICSWVPLINAARCQTRRSGSARSTSASASCTRRRRSKLAL
jgi:hypothetical protein